MRRLLWIAALLLVPASFAAAQATPEEAAAAFGAALKANDWPAAARLMHPQALQQLRGMFEPLIAMPGVEQLGDRLFGAHSQAEFAAIPDTILFASFLRASLSQQPGLTDAMRTAVISPLGHIAAGGDTVLVVSRVAISIDSLTITQFDVMPFVPLDGRWRGLLKADFTNMAKLLERSLNARRS